MSSGRAEINSGHLQTNLSFAAFPCFYHDFSPAAVCLAVSSINNTVSHCRFLLFPVTLTHLALTLDLYTNCSRSPVVGTSYGLIKIDLFRNRLPAHVAYLESFATFWTGTMPAQECYISTTFHADTTAMRFLDLDDFALEVPQPVGRRMPAILWTM